MQRSENNADDAKAKLTEALGKHLNALPPDQLEKAAEFFAQNQDLFPADHLVRGLRGLPPDPEFGPLEPCARDTVLRISVDCPPWGIQTLEIILRDLPGLDPASRSLIRLIRCDWPHIWSQALRKWDGEYPGETEMLRDRPRKWVLEAEVQASLLRGVSLLTKWLPKSAGWNLGVSGNQAARMLSMSFRGSKLSSAELI